MALRLQKTNLEANRLRRTFLEAQKKLFEKDIEAVRNNLHYVEADRNGKIEAVGGQLA